MAGLGCLNCDFYDLNNGLWSRSVELSVRSSADYH